MGVTIHFEGRLKNAQALSDLLFRVEQIAHANTLLTEQFDNREVQLPRVRNEKPEDYVGPTKGIVLYLHDQSDPVRLEFDRDLYIQEFVKTQFAGANVHIRLIRILKDLQVFFDTFDVTDEGQYWETEDEALLADHISRCNMLISEFAAKNPAAQIKVKGPDGRFIDMIE